jgi:hypothetical protein
LGKEWHSRAIPVGLSVPLRHSDVESPSNAAWVLVNKHRGELQAKAWRELRDAVHAAGKRLGKELSGHTTPTDHRIAEDESAIESDELVGEPTESNSGKEPRRVDAGGYHVWIQASGHGSPTVVFESDGGDDSSVWSSVEPEVRHRNAVATVVYYRAGLGRSEPKSGPYRIDNEVEALRMALPTWGIHGPIVLVAHSYGGFVSLLTAAVDPRVAGLALVDANLSPVSSMRRRSHDCTRGLSPRLTRSNVRTPRSPESWSR